MFGKPDKRICQTKGICALFYLLCKQNIIGVCESISQVVSVFLLLKEMEKKTKQ